MCAPLDTSEDIQAVQAVQALLAPDPLTPLALLHHIPIHTHTLMHTEIMAMDITVMEIIIIHHQSLVQFGITC